MTELEPLILGTTYTVDLQYTDSNDAPIDLTGATATLQIKKHMVSQALVDVSATITEAEGRIEFKITPTESDALTLQRAEEEFLIGAVLTLDGDVINLLQSTLLVKQNIVQLP